MDRIAIASRWITALTKKGATPLKELAEVLDDGVRTTTLTGKDAVLAWFRSFPGMSMFRTGTWGPPSASGDVVTATCRFDPKAAYHSATMWLTIDAAGKITYATSLLRAAPDPLGSVIHRVWGPRAGTERLPEHLGATYGVEVKKVTALQRGNHGVFRADLTSGEPWVVRVFPSDRPIADVEGDAAILRFLESRDHPAERCVADVSVHEGQGVLVTGFVAGSKLKRTVDTHRALGDLVGRLHAMTGAPKAVRRDAGGLHLYTVDCTVRSEIATASASLDAAAFRGITDPAWEAMCAALDAADDFASLPKALLHPDPAPVNAIAANTGPTLIDWAGAGYGPRVLGLGLLLGACVTGRTFDRDATDAIMEAYTAHVSPTAPEYAALEAATQHRGLIHEAYAWGVGIARERKPGTFRSWPHDNAGIAAMAAHVRERWA